MVKAFSSASHRKPIHLSSSIVTLSSSSVCIPPKISSEAEQPKMILKTKNESRANEGVKPRAMAFSSTSHYNSILLPCDTVILLGMHLNGDFERGRTTKDDFENDEQIESVKLRANAFSSATYRKPILLLYYHPAIFLGPYTKLSLLYSPEEAVITEVVWKNVRERPKVVALIPRIDGSSDRLVSG